MELLDVVAIRRQSAAILLEQFPSAHNLHALARGTKESHQRLVHLGCLVPHDGGLFVSLQPVHLYDYQTVIGQHPHFIMALVAFHSEADTRQSDSALIVDDDLTVFLSFRFHELVVQAQFIHLARIRIVANHLCQLRQFEAIDHLFLPCNFD